MIESFTGNLLASDCEALVNPVNCVGVMGAGLAAQFKAAYPHNFAVYRAACERGRVKPGRVVSVSVGSLDVIRWIINVPTKRHWRDASRLDDVTLGVHALVAEIRRLRLMSVAVPPLGCGLGGLAWNDVRPVISFAFLAAPNVRVMLYEPGGR